jgi:hypothetical protein
MLKGMSRRHGRHKLALKEEKLDGEAVCFKTSD